MRQYIWSWTQDSVFLESCPSDLMCCQIRKTRFVHKAPSSFIIPVFNCTALNSYSCTLCSLGTKNSDPKLFLTKIITLTDHFLGRVPAHMSYCSVPFSTLLSGFSMSIAPLIHGFSIYSFSYPGSTRVWKQMIPHLTYHQKVNSSLM